jgi:serine/threonine protein kinase
VSTPRARHPTPTDYPSSAKDQLSGTSVAIKKIMKPFSTPVLSKRTYRELKLLKHLRHENVSVAAPAVECRRIAMAQATR